MLLPCTCLLLPSKKKVPGTPPSAMFCQSDFLFSRRDSRLCWSFSLLYELHSPPPLPSPSPIPTRSLFFMFACSFPFSVKSFTRLALSEPLERASVSCSFLLLKAVCRICEMLMRIWIRIRESVVPLDYESVAFKIQTKNKFSLICLLG